MAIELVRIKQMILVSESEIRKDDDSSNKRVVVVFFHTRFKGSSYGTVV